jgi:glycine/D-amino acid oxidase-like deaminating enzyme
MPARERLWGEPPWPPQSFRVHPLRGAPAETIVVGGGLTGAAAALWLARAGRRTLLLEAGRFGDGASGRTGGIVLEGTAWGARAGANRCVPELQRLVDTERIECALEIGGCWEIEHREGAGDDRLPWRDGASAIRIARRVAGGVVDPLALLAGLANRAADAGALLHQHARATRIVAGAKPSVEVGGLTLEAREVVVATNAWTGLLLPGIRPTRAALTFAIASAPLGDATLRAIGLDPPVPFYTIDLPYLWGRLTADRRLIMGAGLIWDDAGALETMDVSEGEGRAVLDRLEERVRRLHPALAEVRFEHRWAGPIAIPDGQAPQIGRLGAESNLFVASGYAGHGVALSVAAGTMVARAILEDAPLPEWSDPRLRRG